MKYSIRFTLFPRPRTDGTRTIRMIVSWKGLSVQHYLSSSLMEDDWDARQGRPKRTCRKAIREMDDVTAAVARVFDLAHLDKRIPTVDDVRAALGKIHESTGGSMLLTEAMKQFMREQGEANDWALGTGKRFMVLSSHLKSWRKNATTSDVNEAMMRDFVSHLYSEGLVNTTVKKNISQLRWFLRWCVRKGYVTDITWDCYRPRIKTTDKEVIYLTEGELRSLIDLDLSGHPFLIKVRDVFLFCCFTGLRYSDVAKLSWPDVHEDHIRVVTKKTNDPLRIELNSTSRALIEKYRSEDTGKGLVFPVISNQKMNDHIKVLGRMAGIDEPVRKVSWVKADRHEEVIPKWQLLSTHAGRRTFVVTALSLEIPTEVIMRWTGHSDHKAMKPYIAIVDKLKEKNMAKFDSILKD